MYPDALVILNHRDPVPAVKSFIPMVVYVAGFWNARVDAELFARYNLGMLSSRMRRMVAEIDSVPKAQILHVPFRRFVEDNLGVAWEMARFAGLPETDAARRALSAYVAGHPRQGAAKLDYRIDTLGLDLDELRREFAQYIELFKEWI